MYIFRYLEAHTHTHVQACIHTHSYTDCQAPGIYAASRKHKQPPGTCPKLVRLAAKPEVDSPSSSKVILTPKFSLGGRLFLRLCGPGHGKGGFSTYPLSARARVPSRAASHPRSFVLPNPPTTASTLSAFLYFCVRCLRLNCAMPSRFLHSSSPCFGGDVLSHLVSRNWRHSLAIL